jgi:hypothetical protein
MLQCWLRCHEIETAHFNFRAPCSKPCLRSVHASRRLVPYKRRVLFTSWSEQRKPLWHATHEKNESVTQWQSSTHMQSQMVSGSAFDCSDEADVPRSLEVQHSSTAQCDSASPSAQQGRGLHCNGPPRRAHRYNKASTTRLDSQSQEAKHRCSWDGRNTEHTTVIEHARSSCTTPHVLTAVSSITSTQWRIATRASIITFTSTPQVSLSRSLLPDTKVHQL